MICHHCNTQNEDDYDFCVSCGQPINATVQRPMPPLSQPFYATPTSGGIESPTRTSSSMPWLLGVLGALIVLLIVAGIFAFYQLTPGEVLPSHIGLFIQTDARDRVDEIRRHEFANAIEGRASLLKDDSLPAIPSAPNLILNDGSINVNDVRLVQLDTIKDDGSMKTIDLQAAQVEGKPEMKRLRVPDGLANGKYAFAIFDTYINEGKHRLWPFQVRDSSKGDNGAALRAASVPLKPKAPAVTTTAAAPAATTTAPVAPPPMPAAPAPTGTRFIRGNYVRVRVGPGTSYGFHPTFRFKSGQSVNVISYEGYECPKSGKGCGRWAQIQGGYYVHESLLR